MSTETIIKSGEGVMGDGMTIDENSWVHGAGGGIDEGFYGSEFTGA